MNKKKVKQVKQKSNSVNFLDKILEIKWLILFFIPFLIVQLYHISHELWDTQAYIFGGKWFCGQQIYLELIRPPLPAVVNCLFGAGDYALIFSTLLFALAYFAAIVLIYLKNKHELNELIFGAFSFLFPAILFGSNYGSDLPALAFLLLALYCTGSLKKGTFFALATLSRYNFLLFGLVFIFELRKKPKEIIWFLVPLVLLWIPWMIFNYLMTGNPLFSLYETTYLNFQMKSVVAPLAFEHLIVIGLFLILLLINGLKKEISIPLNQAAIISGIMFVVSKIKEMRFINVLVPAIAFNAALLVGRRKKLSVFLVFILLVFLYYLFGIFSPNWYGVVSVPEDNFIKNCRVASDKWVFFYSHGIVAECSYDIGDWNKFVASGGNFVLYDYKNIDLNGFNVINRGDYVIVKSDYCAPQPKKYISGSLRNYVIKWLKDSNSNFYDYSDWVE